MSEDPRVEAVARVLCERYGENPDTGTQCVSPGTDAIVGIPLWRDFIPEAHAALAAADAADKRDEVINCARFLVDRLQEYEPDHNDQVTMYFGHIEPALERLENALEALPTPPKEQSK